MKQFFLFIFLFTGSLLSFSQEFTRPDSAAIIKNQVKSIKIYYTGTGSEHLITQEYRYNKKGQCIYESDGLALYHYVKSYYDNGLLKFMIRRDDSGKMLGGSLYEYYAGGEVKQTLVFSEVDSLNPAIIYDYDRYGNKTGENYFTKGKLTFAKTIYYDSVGKVTGYKDSIPRNHTGVHDTQHLLSERLFDSTGKWKETWIFEYDKQGKIAQVTQKRFMDKDNIFTFVNGELDKMEMNHNPASQQKKDEFKSKWGLLFPPEEQGEEYGLPYSDPKSSYEYTHQVILDKKNNIKKDIVNCKYPMNNCPTVEFDYEYTYW